MRCFDARKQVWQLCFTDVEPPLDKSRHFGRHTRVLLCGEYRDRQERRRKPENLIAALRPVATGRNHRSEKAELFEKQSGYCLCHGRKQLLHSMIMFHTVEVPEP